MTGAPSNSTGAGDRTASRRRIAGAVRTDLGRAGWRRVVCEVLRRTHRGAGSGGRCDDMRAESVPEASSATSHSQNPMTPSMTRSTMPIGASTPDTGTPTSYRW